MPSQQSEAVREHWIAARRAMTDPNAPQPDDESWGDLTAEPRGVDYTETTAAGLPAMWATPKQAATDRVLLAMHGGGYIGGSIYTHRKMFAHLAKAAGARALIFDYRLAPAYTHPTQVNDATDVYRWLLDQGIRPEHIAFTGDSAGGGMSISTQLLAREQGLPMPSAAVVFSPWVDMAATGMSYGTNRDPFFLRESVLQFAAIFLGPDGDPSDPLATPVNGDLAGLAPTYIQVGGDEALLDDANRLADQLKQAGTDVRLDVFPDMLHTFQMAAGRAPEADDAIQRAANWVRPLLDIR